MSLIDMTLGVIFAHVLAIFAAGCLLVAFLIAYWVEFRSEGR